MVRPSSALIAVVTGVAATVLAGVIPALRAARVPPLAALREFAFEPPTVSRPRVITGAGLILG